MSTGATKLINWHSPAVGAGEIGAGSEPRSRTER